MNEQRLKQEVELVRSHFPSTDPHHSRSWILITDWQIPEATWKCTSVNLCIRIPDNYPGQAPYAFYVQPFDLKLKDGSNPNNAQLVSDTVYGGTWLKFSWAAENWSPDADINRGSNLLNFLNSIRTRFAEGK